MAKIFGGKITSNDEIFIFRMRRISSTLFCVSFDLRQIRIWAIVIIFGFICTPIKGYAGSRNQSVDEDIAVSGMSLVKCLKHIVNLSPPRKISKEEIENHCSSSLRTAPGEFLYSNVPLEYYTSFKFGNGYFHLRQIEELGHLRLDLNIESPCLGFKDVKEIINGNKWKENPVWFNRLHQRRRNQTFREGTNANIYITYTAEYPECVSMFMYLIGLK